LSLDLILNCSEPLTVLMKSLGPMEEHILLARASLVLDQCYECDVMSGRSSLGGSNMDSSTPPLEVLVSLD
jgi:hypothetical protein